MNHLMTRGLTLTARWRSNGRSKRHFSSRRVTWMHPDASSPIERMRLNHTVLIKRRVISAVDCNGPLDPTVTPKFFYKFTVLRDWNLTLGFLRLIEFFRQHNSSVHRFISLLDTFPRPRSIWNQKLIERIRRNHILNAIFFFEIAEWKAMNPAINWIVSRANLG